MIGDNKDVGFAEDWIFTVQNLVSAEHHAIESWCQTKDVIFLELNKKLREYRSKLLYMFTPENKSQTYCINKHLHGSAQGLKELGNRFTENGEDGPAKEMFEISQDIEAIIILLNGFEPKKQDIEEKSFINKLFKGGQNV
jgi:hypothetical protein